MVAIHFLQDIPKLKSINYFNIILLLLLHRSDNHAYALFNVKEDKITDVSKLKKRKQGRSLKIIADLCLLVGSYKVKNFFAVKMIIYRMQTHITIKLVKY